MFYVGIPQQGAEREDCFDKREGVEFLTSEVGLDEGTLPAEGEEIAGLVGYQKVSRLIGAPIRGSLLDFFGILTTSAKKTAAMFNPSPTLTAVSLLEQRI